MTQINITPTTNLNTDIARQSVAVITQSNPKMYQMMLFLQFLHVNFCIAEKTCRAILTVRDKRSPTHLWQFRRIQHDEINSTTDNHTC